MQSSRARVGCFAAQRCFCHPPCRPATFGTKDDRNTGLYLMLPGSSPLGLGSAGSGCQGKAPKALRHQANPKPKRGTPSTLQSQILKPRENECRASPPWPRAGATPIPTARPSPGSRYFSLCHLPSSLAATLCNTSALNVTESRLRVLGLTVSGSSVFESHAWGTWDDM